MLGPEGAWPPERRGGPRETSGLRGYKGACKRSYEITHQSVIATYHSKHRCWCFFAPRNVTSGASRGLRKNFSRLPIARHILRPPHNLHYTIRPLIAVVNVNVSLTSVTLNCESWYIKSIGLRNVTLLQSTKYIQIINYHKAYMSKFVNTKLFHFLDKLGR